MSNSNCVFCKIVSGEIPSHRIYEDEHVYAFLDIGPLSEGHTLVIPKHHYVTLDELPYEAAAACGSALARVGKAVAQTVGRDGWNVLQNNGEAAGQLVMHAHFHIIPYSESEGLRFRWDAGQIDHASAAKLKDAIVANLGAAT